MKLGIMKSQLPAALADADRVFCYGNKLGWDPAEALRPLGARAQSFDDLGALIAAVAQHARPGDHVLVMSNGGFGGVHARLLDAFSALPAAVNATAAAASMTASAAVAATPNAAVTPTTGDDRGDPGRASQPAPTA